MEEKRRPLLLVEDDPALLKQMRWAFDGYETLPAEDRESAIALLRRHEPAVVTMDLGLPPAPDDVTEGFRLLTEILQLQPSTKVIVLTGQHDRENAVRAVGMGAYDFFAKPFEPDLLSLAIDRAYRLHDLQHLGGLGVAQADHLDRLVIGLVETADQAFDAAVVLAAVGQDDEVRARHRGDHRLGGEQRADDLDHLLRLDILQLDDAGLIAAVDDAEGRAGCQFAGVRHRHDPVGADAFDNGQAIEFEDREKDLEQLVRGQFAGGIDRDGAAHGRVEDIVATGGLGHDLDEAAQVGVAQIELDLGRCDAGRGDGQCHDDAQRQEPGSWFQKVFHNLLSACP